MTVPEGFKPIKSTEIPDNVLNPTLGYTKENCRVVIWWYNLCKATWSDDEVFKIIKQWINNKEYNGKLC